MLTKIDAVQLQLTGQARGFCLRWSKQYWSGDWPPSSPITSDMRKGDPVGRELPNARNGFTPKTVASEVGDVGLAIPPDRDGSFTSTLVSKGSRRLGGLDDMINSLYAGGMTVHVIQRLRDSTGLHRPRQRRSPA